MLSFFSIVIYSGFMVNLYLLFVLSNLGIFSSFLFINIFSSSFSSSNSIIFLSSLFLLLFSCFSSFFSIFFSFSLFLSSSSESRNLLLFNNIIFSSFSLFLISLLSDFSKYLPYGLY